MFDEYESELEKVEQRFEEIEAQLVLPDVVSDRELYARLMREHAEIQEVVDVYRQRRSIAAQLEEALANEGLERDQSEQDPEKLQTFHLVTSLPADRR